jgi:hypothetical protein
MRSHRRPGQCRGYPTNPLPTGSLSRIKSAGLDLDGGGVHGRERRLTRRDGGLSTQLQSRYKLALFHLPRRPHAAIYPPRATQVGPKGGAGDGTRTRDIQLGNRARQAHFMPVRAGL